ncbi:protocadherin gamma-A10-like [Morone saxatilis]|uniref:protocadherin gamma-A10-like n=1 Tax=Morone saxatilis TaxID=34816 RepID=UPI0015E25217|nr:protocadherin gamma-A10-like [Morone saxatilis]
MEWQVLLFISVLSLTVVLGQVSYSIPEEMAKGALIGNIAQDLGLGVERLKSGKARIYTGNTEEYIELKRERGVLLVKNRIDRESLCGQTMPCALHFQMILENPMEFYTVTVEITDINDNPPTFERGEMKYEISESALTGARFVLEKAIDNDVGVNGLSSYALKPSDNFVLKTISRGDGTKHVEMVLQKQLDRENQEHMSLILTALDGGEPQLSGTMQIIITVLDVNDNPPVCSKLEYKASVIENAPVGTLITTVKATDADSGSNGLVTYRFSNMKEQLADIFHLDEITGTITLVGQVDFEKDKKCEIMIEAMDQGGLTDSSKVLIEIVDVNDNAPVINVMSFSSPVPEDSASGTTVAIINVIDADSEQNGQITCTTDSSLPFKIKSTLTNYYALVTDSAFDREVVPEYNITVRATDSGSPPLSSTTILRLRISDVNDNAPLFDQLSYVSYVTENNSPGMSIFSVKAQDTDWNQNARISYLLEETQINGSPTSSYVSINSETGGIHAVRSFDYEQMKQLQLVVKAQDGGSPPLSSNVSVKIMIQDQNLQHVYITRCAGH